MKKTHKLKPEIRLAAVNGRIIETKRRINKRTAYSRDPMASALQKLEAHPRARYEDVLTAEEYNEAVQAIRAAVAYVHECLARQYRKGKRRAKPPLRFSWRGRSFSLSYGVFLGQVFIANKAGKPLIGSAYHAI